MEKDSFFVRKKKRYNIGGCMKKELVICIVVISFVIIGNILTQNYTKKCVEDMEVQLSQFKEVVLQKEKNKEEIMQKMEKIKIKWDGMQEKLAYYIEHDELEKVEAEIALMEGQAESELYDEICPELEKCIFILEHIEDKTALNVKNIF